jgi:hypothetical protein
MKYRTENNTGHYRPRTFAEIMREGVIRRDERTKITQVFEQRARQHSKKSIGQLHKEISERFAEISRLERDPRYTKNRSHLIRNEKKQIEELAVELFKKDIDRMLPFLLTPNLPKLRTNEA